MATSIRAIWILNNNDIVLFSRRFPVVERRWRIAFKKENNETRDPPLLPDDSELSSAFVDRKKRWKD